MQRVCTETSQQHFFLTIWDHHLEVENNKLFSLLGSSRAQMGGALAPAGVPVWPVSCLMSATTPFFERDEARVERLVRSNGQLSGQTCWALLC